MSSKTKIVVLRMKELIYTAIFIGLALVLITLFFIMFRPQKTAEEPQNASVYAPGVYSASMKLGSQSINVEVSVDANYIKGIELVSLDESIATMYPLIKPSLAALQTQIVEKQSLENLEYSADTQYTSQALIKTIQLALDKAVP